MRSSQCGARILAGEIRQRLSLCDNMFPVMLERDRSLDTLLELDGLTPVVDPAGGHWVRFAVSQVPPSPEKPHGLDCSPTLHGRNGDRLVGFDNAHPVGKQKRGDPRDRRHRLRTLKPYDCLDAATPLADFWTEVDAALKEGGVRS
jgi:hypothetical protein